MGRRRGARHPARVAGDRRRLRRRPRTTSARSWSTAPERLARYMRPDELHTTFNLDFLKSPLDPASGCAATIDDTLAGVRHGRRAGDLDAVQPRRDAARDPLRPGARPGVPLPPPWPFPDGRPRAGHPAGPGACCCCMLALPGSVLPLPGRGARACGRSRTCPTSASPGPGLGELRATGSAAGTAAGSRCRGRATSRRSASPPGYAVAAAAGGVAGLHRGGAGAATGLDAGLLPGRAGRPPYARRRPGPDAHLAGWPGRGAGLLPRQLRLHGQPLRPAGAGGRAGAAQQRAGASTGWCRPEVAVWTSGLPGADQAAQHTVHEGR